MQNIEQTVDELAAKGKRLKSFSVKITYRSFIADYGVTGIKAQMAHIVIKCNGKVYTWLRFPIDPAGPFEENIGDYMQSVLEENLKKAADTTLNDAQVGVARSGDVLDFIEFSEGAPLEKSRIVQVADFADGRTNRYSLALFRRARAPGGERGAAIRGR